MDKLGGAVTLLRCHATYPGVDGQGTVEVPVGLLLPPRPHWRGAFAAVAAAAGWDEIWLHCHATVETGDDVIERVGRQAAIGAAVTPSIEDGSPKSLLI